MFLDYEKRRIRCRLISCFPPAHRIRICLQDQFGFRPPPPPHRAQARGGIFRPSYELCCNHTLCSNLFRTTNGLMCTPRVRGGSKLNRTLHDELRHSPASAPRHWVQYLSASAVLCPPSSPSLPILNLFCAGFLFSEWAIGLRAGFS